MAFPPKPGTLIIGVIEYWEFRLWPCPKPIGVIEEYTGNVDYFRV